MFAIHVRARRRNRRPPPAPNGAGCRSSGLCKPAARGPLEAGRGRYPHARSSKSPTPYATPQMRATDPGEKSQATVTLDHEDIEAIAERAAHRVVQLLER